MRARAIPPAPRPVFADLKALARGLQFLGQAAAGDGDEAKAMTVLVWKQPKAPVAAVTVDRLTVLLGLVTSINIAGAHFRGRFLGAE
ncbi:MAG: hypothetical protein ACLPIX_12590 [Rhodomicrobium sp.]